MKVTKPKKNQILIEDDALINFKTEVETVTGMSEDKMMNDLYEGLIFAYRLPNMDSSKQIFYGNGISVLTLFASSLRSLINNNVVSIDQVENLVKLVTMYEE